MTQGVYNGIVSGGQGLNAGVALNNEAALPRAPLFYSQVASSAPSAWTSTYECSVGQPASANPGTYSNGAAAGQGASQSVAIATTAVIYSTGNIPSL